MYINTPVIINGVSYEEWEIKSVCWLLDSSVLTFHIYYYDRDGGADVLHRQLQYSVGEEVNINELIEQIKLDHRYKLFI